MTTSMAAWARAALALGWAALAATANGQALPACTPITFESGNPFTVTGLWHTTTACGASTPSSAHSTPTALYYGIDGQCNFDNGDENSGTATSPPISVPIGFTPAIRFNSIRQAEVDGQFDQTLVQYSTDGGGVWNTVLTGFELRNGEGWNAFSVTLPPIAVPAIQVRFLFDTDDEVSNQGLGWMVDDVQVCSPAFGGAAPVPASSPWGLALVATLLALFAAAALRFRRR